MRPGLLLLLNFHIKRYYFIFKQVLAIPSAKYFHKPVYLELAEMSIISPFCIESKFICHHHQLIFHQILHYIISKIIYFNERARLTKEKKGTDPVAHSKCCRIVLNTPRNLNEYTQKEIWMNYWYYWKLSSLILWRSVLKIYQPSDTWNTFPRIMHVITCVALWPKHTHWKIKYELTTFRLCQKMQVTSNSK